MKTLNKKIASSLLGLLFLSSAVSVSAQEATKSEGGKFSVSADLVSSYVWRGMPQGTTHGGTPNFQPSLTYAIGGLTVGAWGSGSFDGEIKEVDLYATYAFNDLFSATVTDYNWTFTSGRSYFSYKKDKTDHFFEASLNYAGTETFPLSVSLNTMLTGADYNTDGDQAYSTYLELAYPLASNAKLFLGSSLLDSPSMYTPGEEKGFAVTNLGVKVSKEIKFSDTFSLPVYGIVGFNPSADNAYFVAGLTF